MHYILAVAIVNMGLGFCLAMYLGRRYHPAMADSEFYSSNLPPGLPSGEIPPGDAAATPAADFTFQEVPVSQPVETAVETTAEPITQPTAPPPPVETVPPQVPPDTPRAKSPSETSVENLQTEVDQYHDQLTQADEELRKSFESPDPDAIEKVLGSLMEATDDYLRSRGEAQDAFEGLHQDRPEFSGICGDLQAATQRQDEQIERTSKTIKAFDYENELEDGCRQMASETSKLLDANDQLRDTLGEALVGVARMEQRLGDVDPEQRRDPLTGVSNRTGLEADLFEWWEKDPQRSRQLSVAMIDVDHWGAVNEQYGRNVGDRILRAVARLFQSEGRGASTTARLSGQQFFLLFPDADVRFAVNVVERIRQMVETAHFEDGQNDVQITVTCAVTESTAEDTSQKLFDRAKATLEEAKRSGHNRTFSHEGNCPTPVVPPNFSLTEERITV